MCIFILAIMVLLFFYLSDSIIYFQISEQIGDVSIQLNEGWDVLLTLWPAMLFMFLAGVFFVLIALKFVRKPNNTEDD